MDPTTETFAQTEEFAHQQAKGRFSGDKNLRVIFHTLPMPDTEASAKEGRPIFREVEHVKILVPGSKESVVDKVVTNIERTRFSDIYEKWKANEQIDFSGTPLESCTWISKSLVEEMKYFHIRTVEQLANLSDTHASKFPGIRAYQDQAKAYLAQAEKGKAAQELASAMEAKDREIADLHELVKGLQDSVQRLQGVQTSAPPAPRPTRRKASA